MRQSLPRGGLNRFGIPSLLDIPDQKCEHFTLQLTDTRK
jgi:hypothetical protein